ncbi:hypothetical protein ACHAXT_002313 [Thalassiosira profunda]
MPSLKSISRKTAAAAPPAKAVPAPQAPASALRRTSSGSGSMIRSRSGSPRKPPKNPGVSFASPSLSLPDSDAGTMDDDAAEDHDDGDPLVSLFRVHNTNRVKFDLTPPDDDEHDVGPADSHGSESPARKGASGKFKQFVKSHSLTRRRSGNTPSNLTASCLLSKDHPLDMNDPKDAFVKKMLEPTPLRKIGSFLGRKLGSDGEVKSSSVDLAHEPAFTTIEGITGAGGAPPSAPRGSISRATKESVAKKLKRAKRAHKKTFRYRTAMKYYLLALKEMTNAGYPDTDPLMKKVLQSLNDVHHAQSTLENSANIVQMGIQNEDQNQLVKALRMYTIAYRMRRDSLGVDHPSLAVLLNMMGSVQVKRGEYGEAMKIYELSLKGRPDENGGKGRNKEQFRNQNPLTTSVTLRDMGMILEHKGNEEKALKFYHASLRYAVKNKEATERIAAKKAESGKGEGSDMESDAESSRAPSPDASAFGRDWLESNVDEPFSLQEVRMAKTTALGKNQKARSNDAGENGEMELFIEQRFDRWALSTETAGKSNSTKFYYDELFTSQQDDNQQIQKAHGEGADMDIAMALHQIGQIHRRGHRYDAALSAYNASLRGMKEVLGTKHGNIAAILGNIGNLYMETGDYDEAFAIYQEVLGIETLHLGLSHPEVAVTLHNIATIECSRGNYAEGVSLYKQVVDMQKIRYGNEHLTVAITLSCLADAYEKLRNVKGAIKTYEEALKIRIAVLGKSHLDVGRLMHKLGRLASLRQDYACAEIYMARAAEIYTDNKLRPDHIFLREMARDNADIQAGLAFGKK